LPTPTSVDNSRVEADPSDFADPLSVNNLGDEQLNETFERMSAAFSTDAILFNNIGAVYYERKMYDKAEVALTRAIVLNDQPAFLTNLSMVYDAENRLPEALSAAERAVAQSPRYERGRNELCELLLMSKRDADTVACYDELSRISKLDDLGETYYAVASLHLGNADKAISVLSPIVESGKPISMAYDALGYAYYIKKRYPQAVETFKRGVEIDPDNSGLRFNLAVALTAVHDRAGALLQYSLMKKKDPSLADQLYRGLNRDKIIYVDEATASKKQ
jgi:tetratricopeptide (TPR) repeat protein